MPFEELVVDNIEPEKKDIIYLRSSNLDTCVYLASNIFEQPQSGTVQWKK